MRNTSRQKALKAVLVQFIAVILLSAVALCFGRIYCISVLFGGMAAVVPNLLFALGLFGRIHRSGPGQLLARFYIGALCKIAISVAVMMWVVMTMSVSILAVLISFLLAMFVFTATGVKR